MTEQFEKLNVNVNQNIKKVLDSIKTLNEKVKSNEYQFENGNSFLNLKNTLMLQYLSNMAYFVLLKLKHNRIEDQKCVQRLAELRCVFDKIKPIEAKLKYQIDKSLKLAENPTKDENNPLNFKPNTNNFNDAEDEEEEDEDENLNESDNDNDTGKKDGVYRPPKLAPMHCDVDETPQDKLNKRIEKAKKHALSSSLIKDLQMQYSDAPEEIINNYANALEYNDKEAKHRQEYEEENFVRKPLTKQEMVRAKRLQHGANLNHLTAFDDTRVLLDENLNMEDYMQSKKKKLKNAKTGKKGSKKLKKKKRIRYT